MNYSHPFLLALSLTCLVTTSAQAKMNLNQAQECQAVLDFTIDRVEAVKKYDPAQVKTATKGLKAYEAFLQNEYVTPGLLEFTKGIKMRRQTIKNKSIAIRRRLSKGCKRNTRKSEFLPTRPWPLIAAIQLPRWAKINYK